MFNNIIDNLINQINKKLIVPSIEIIDYSFNYEYGSIKAIHIDIVPEYDEIQEIQLIKTFSNRVYNHIIDDVVKEFSFVYGNFTATIEKIDCMLNYINIVVKWELSE